MSWGGLHHFHQSQGSHHFHHPYYSLHLFFSLSLVEPSIGILFLCYRQIILSDPYGSDYPSIIWVIIFLLFPFLILQIKVIHLHVYRRSFPHTSTFLILALSFNIFNLKINIIWERLNTNLDDRWDPRNTLHMNFKSHHIFSFQKSQIHFLHRPNCRSQLTYGLII